MLRLWLWNFVLNCSVLKLVSESMFVVQYAAHNNNQLNNNKPNNMTEQPPTVW